MLNAIVLERKHEDIAAQIAARLTSLNWKTPDGLFISQHYPFHSGQRSPELIVISGKAAENLKLKKYARCRTLLFPGNCKKPLVKAEYTVSYGMSAGDSITFSSIGSKEYVLSIQKELTLPNGNIVECQELPIRRRFGVSSDSFLAAVGTMLLLGVPPSKLY